MTKEKPARANRSGVLRDFGNLCGDLTAMPPVANTGKAEFVAPHHPPVPGRWLLTSYSFFHRPECDGVPKISLLG